MKKSSKNFWIYGKHACISALKNKNRKCIELLTTRKFYEGYRKEIEEYINSKSIKVQLVRNKVLNSFFKGSSYLEVALKVSPLPYNLNIKEIANSSHISTIVILDQVTDTRNIGSILRTSACFGVDAVVLPHNHSPEANASIAKVASGAFDITPLIYVTNIVKTIKTLKEFGYWCYGFDCNSEKNLKEIKNFQKKTLIIFGSEEKGIRKLVKKNCDYLLKIPISKAVNSLNVSNAAAIGIYSICCRRNK